MRKPRPEGILNTLSREARAFLHECFAEETLTYPQVAARLWEKYGVKVSNSALSNYYQKYGAAV